ncbi:MAG: hypothetical protein IEMM0007_1178 [bacterium]|nr:MAG: hypothetical protein IEMM0007_1178 [bacterium]
MDILFRVGGLQGVELGGLLGVDYSTISRGKNILT